jgi:hypothetical protein
MGIIPQGQLVKKIFVFKEVIIIIFLKIGHKCFLSDIYVNDVS